MLWPAARGSARRCSSCRGEARAGQGVGGTDCQLGLPPCRLAGSCRLACLHVWGCLLPSPQPWVPRCRPPRPRSLGPRKAAALLRAVMRVGGFVESRAQVGGLVCGAAVCIRRNTAQLPPQARPRMACQCLCHRCRRRTHPASRTTPPHPPPPHPQVWRELGVLGNRVFRNAAAYLRIRASTKGARRATPRCAMAALSLLRLVACCLICHLRPALAEPARGR